MGRKKIELAIRYLGSNDRAGHFLKPMKRLCLIVAWFIQPLFAGESCLTMTYQPLDGLGSGSIHIVQVACYDWYATSGMATQIGLISVPNVPPTNNRKEATEDLNLASICGVRFEASDIGDPQFAPGLTLDATKFAVPTRFSHSPENVLRASLECFRRCLPDKLRNTPVILKCGDADRGWMSNVVFEFNAHDRAKVFLLHHRNNYGQRDC